jgi:hypothetical protein
VLLGILARTFAGVLPELRVGESQSDRRRLRVLLHRRVEETFGEGRLGVGTGRDHREELVVFEFVVHVEPKQNHEYFFRCTRRSWPPRRHRGVGSDDQLDFVDVEQLGVDAGYRSRLALVIVIDELDGTRQAALGVYLFFPNLHSEQRLLAVGGERPGRDIEKPILIGSCACAELPNGSTSANTAPATMAESFKLR